MDPIVWLPVRLRSYRSYVHLPVCFQHAALGVRDRVPCCLAARKADMSYILSLCGSNAPVKARLRLSPNRSATGAPNETACGRPSDLVVGTPGRTAPDPYLRPFRLRHNVAMLVSTAAIPRRNDPSIITIADSFPGPYVRYMFSCRKEGFYATGAHVRKSCVFFRQFSIVRWSEKQLRFLDEPISSPFHALPNCG